jgi:predicted DsbA family dithiol-disulfide isomerase
MKRRRAGHKSGARLPEGGHRARLAAAERGSRGAREKEVPVRLEVFSDFVCPFSYLAEPALERLRAEGVTVAYRAFELRPYPAPLPDPADPGAAAAWTAAVAPLAERLGIEIRRPPLQPRSRKAHELAAFAAEKGCRDEVRRALYRAHFVEGRDIGRIDVLVELAAGAGLDASEAKVVLDLDSYAAGVVAAQQEAWEREIVGVPSFVAGTRLLVGWHDYRDLRAAAVPEQGDGDEWPATNG